MTPSQIAAILLILQAFGVSTTTIASIQNILEPQGTSTPVVLATSTPAIMNSSSPTSATGSSAPAPFPLKIFRLVYEPEQNDFYYSGSKPLTSLKVDGVEATSTMSKFLDKDCAFLDGEKHCGLHVARYEVASQKNPATVELTTADGEVVSQEVRTQ